MPITDSHERRAYMRAYMRQRYIEYKAFLMERLGGRCSICGRTDALEFDHVVRYGKVTELSNASRLARAKWEAEAAKCQILCWTCHDAKTAIDLGWRRGHGTVSEYRKGCRCSQCRSAAVSKARKYAKARMG